METRPPGLNSQAIATNKPCNIPGHTIVKKFPQRHSNLTWDMHQAPNWKAESLFVSVPTLISRVDTYVHLRTGVIYASDPSHQQCLNWNDKQQL